MSRHYNRKYKEPLPGEPKKIAVQLDPDQYAIVKERARRAGHMAISTFLRMAVFEWLAKNPD